MRARISLGSIRRHVPGQYLWPVLLLVGTCFACIVAVLFVTTDAQDRLQHSRERHSLERALDAASDMVVHDLEDYAKWDDAVRHITPGVERGWMADNVVAYLGDTQGYNYIFVLDGQDRTVFANYEGEVAATDADHVLNHNLRSAIDKVRALPVDGSPILGGYARNGKDLYVHAVAQIVPLTKKVALPPGPTHLMVIAQRVDSAFLDRIAATQRLSGLSVHRSAPADDSIPAVPMIGIDGTPQAWLSWHQASPGAELREKIVPIFLGVGLLTLVVAALIVWRGAQTVQALRRSEADARHQADHDPLTDLANRRAMVGRLADAARDGALVTLFSLDLDGFKDVNDLYGHAAGDLLLCEAARRIAAAVPDAFVARVGGDEFAALFTNPGRADLARNTGAILAAFDDPFAIGDYWVTLGVSIGCVDRDEPGLRGEDEIIRRADTAMYAAKAEGKRCWRIYQPSMDQDHRLRVAMESDLRAAIDAGAIDVVYQPVVEAESGAIQSIEALSRWTHPIHGPVPPDIFIPLAERSGMINALGHHVLRRACREALATPYRLNVNLSPAQFWDRNLVADIAKALDETGFPGERLELEITENYLLRRPDAAAAILEEVRGLGISIALDDFGTGFASIGYLRQLHFDRVKIDKGFIAPLAEGGAAADLVCAIAALARSLGLAITAEGVETEEQARLARLAGCSQLQGWLYGRPRPIAALARRGARAA